MRSPLLTSPVWDNGGDKEEEDSVIKGCINQL